MSSLRPYVPSSAAPWDRRRTGHLLRRAAFGATEAEVRRALADGPEATVGRLISGEPQPAAYLELDALFDSLRATGSVENARGWWVLRLVRSAHPLATKMTVFWHDHFATSVQKVDNAGLMLKQLRLFESHALGGFGPLLEAISKDPAMILWLDTHLSRKGAPNENYARELFELFALGVGHYTERDIQEAARAFTGWRVRDGAAVFNPGIFDDGEKSVLGRTGRFGAEDLVRLVLEHEACAPFLARKLLEEFVHPDPSAELVAALAKVLREADYSIAEALRVLLCSEAFFSDEAYRSRIKSPVEYAVGAARALGAKLHGPQTGAALAKMGQKLFEPPSVKGWDGGRNWINSATMLARMNAAAVLTRGDSAGGAIDVAGLLAGGAIIDATGACDFAFNLLLDGDPGEALARAVREQTAGQDAASALRTSLYAALVSPVYQLA
ncbi:MAG: DUF1800 family protein [Phycisphaerae bacterium]|nr:MAG: DUF1800 domain-containing protein [Planctomycetota bacterium]KAB2946340.1 MAG: DUF1800 domain-containing protein [Phycisphaerae bacterium]MBE7455789.1 DUF1800 domain-containing protein [Planctomycetia bacterium]MCK6463424.1 DUF1800 domain-containing protein [Phycisphaerae bacterium]MCL4717046.1 DUF1800 family protein [Phycisphaerae bacterium]